MSIRRSNNTDEYRVVNCQVIFCDGLVIVFRGLFRGSKQETEEKCGIRTKNHWVRITDTTNVMVKSM